MFYGSSVFWFNRESMLHLCSLSNMCFTLRCPRKAMSGCSSDTCRNGGVCQDLWSHYFCECKSPFTGSNCATGKDKNKNTYKKTLLKLVLTITFSAYRFPHSQYYLKNSPYEYPQYVNNCTICCEHQLFYICTFCSLSIHTV